MLPVQSIPIRPPAPPADTSAADSAAAAADTLSLGERLRADSTLQQLTDPETFGRFFVSLRETFVDPALWLGLVGSLLHVLLIFSLAWLAIRVIDRGSHRWEQRFEGYPPAHPRRQRAYTVSNLLSSTARYLIWPLAIITVLSEVGIDVGALIATAGIAGLAIGFGAQTLVKDVISGVFLLFDDSIHVGDLVRLGTDAGVVEHIGVRLIKVRKFDGELLMIPAGELRTFGNRSIGFARLIVEVGLSYEQDVESIVPVLQRVANEWAEDNRGILLEDAPQVQGILAFADSAVTLRIVAQVVPGEQWGAERDIRMRLKRTFDEVGIEIPFPRRTLYMRNEDDLPTRKIVDPAARDQEGEAPG